MTKATRAALRLIGIPTVAWSDQYGQWFVRVGYRYSRSGKRQRAYFYLGTDEKAAVAKAAKIKADWRDIKRKGGAAAVWPSDGAAKLTADQMTEAEAAAQHHAEMDEDAREQGEVIVYSRDRTTGRAARVGSDTVADQTPRQRIEQARESYLEYRRGKRGIVGGQGINDRSYLNEVRNLKAAMVSVDEKAMIDTLGYAEIERLRDSIFRRVDGTEKGIGKRTANNYWNEVRRFLEWAHRQGNVAYTLPPHGEDLFKQKFRNPNPINIAQYDPKQLAKLLAGATDRQRLYIYLGLNCGYTQNEIANIRRDEIVKDDGGKTAIVRKRSKTSHQNDFEAMHTLWPETLALLNNEKATRGDLALLSEAGTPLVRKQPHCDIISDTYLGLQHRTGVALPFKQFRKLGATALQRIGGDEARRLYKAGTVDSGDKVYVRNAWEKLTPHLTAWGDELRRDGVLT